MFRHAHGFCHYPGSGLIQLLILKILFKKPSHGYQIMDDVEKLTGGRYIPEPGALYTMLRRLEVRGLVVSEWEKKDKGADRRVYTLTKEGKAALKEGLKMLKKRQELMDQLVQFYEQELADDEKGGDLE